MMQSESKVDESRWADTAPPSLPSHVHGGELLSQLLTVRTHQRPKPKTDLHVDEEVEDIWGFLT